MNNSDNMVKIRVYCIPMMSDERWQELARENAVHNYTKHFGHAPQDTQTAVTWQRNWLASMAKTSEKEL